MKIINFKQQLEEIAKRNYNLGTGVPVKTPFGYGFVEKIINESECQVNHVPLDYAGDGYVKIVPVSKIQTSDEYASHNDWYENVMIELANFKGNSTDIYEFCNSKAVEFAQNNKNSIWSFQFALDALMRKAWQLGLMNGEGSEVEMADNPFASLYEDDEYVTASNMSKDFELDVTDEMEIDDINEMNMLDAINAFRKTGDMRTGWSILLNTSDYWKDFYDREPYESYVRYTQIVNKFE